MTQRIASWTPLLAQAEAEYEALEKSVGGRLTEGLLLMVVGMGVVFCALILIGLCITLLGAWLRRVEAKPVEVSTEEASPIVQTASADEDSRELVAVLTAAAMAVVGRPVNVRRVTFVNPNTVSGWAEIGRVAIHTSHNLRRNM